MSHEAQSEQTPAQSREPHHQAAATHTVESSGKSSADADRMWTPKGKGDAITPVLHGLTRDLTNSLDSLDIENDTPERRQQLVDVAAQEIGDASKIVAVLLDDVPGSGRAAYAPAIERVAALVSKLVRFVRSRAPHKQLEQRLMVGVGELDHVLVKVHVRTIDSRGAAVLSERATHTSAVEAAGVSAGHTSVGIALERIKDRQLQAVTDFYNLALLQDREAPSFVQELLKAIAVAVMLELSEVFFAVAIADVAMGAAHAVEGAGHAVAGAAHAAEVGGHAAAGAAHAAESSHLKQEIMVKLLTGTTEGVKEAAAEGEETQHEAEGKEGEGKLKVDSKSVALIYFRGQLTTGISDRFGGYQHSLNRMVKDGEVGEADLSRMESTFTKMQSAVHEQYLMRTSQAWATYLAKSKLGTHRAGNQKVSDMHDYFGKEQGNGRAFGTDRSGGDGVLSVSYDVDAPGRRPHIVEDETKVIGVNSALKNQILKAADHRLTRVPLPKEVHVHAGFGRATIALDETNRIRDERNWHEVEKYVGVTAYQFWTQWVKTQEIR